MAFDFGRALTSTASGAASGAPAGPWGAVGGGAVGFVSSLFGGKKKKKKKPKTISTLDPMQQGVYKDYVASLRGEGPFSDLYNFDAEGANNVFDQNIARPAYRGYQENVVPKITGQFRQNNLQNSSYAAESLSRAGRDVQESLDAKRAEMQFLGQQNAQTAKRNAIPDILNRTTFDYQNRTQKPPSAIDQILGKVVPEAGNYLADFVRSKGGGSGSNNSNLNNIDQLIRSGAMTV